MIVPVHIDNHCGGGGMLTQKLRLCSAEKRKSFTLRVSKLLDSFIFWVNYSFKNHCFKGNKLHVAQSEERNEGDKKAMKQLK